MCRLQEAEEAEKKQSRRTQFMYVKNCQVRDVDKYAKKKEPVVEAASMCGGTVSDCT